MSKTKFNALKNKFKKICEENNIDYKLYDLGFVIYPDGYTKGKNQFYLELFSIEDYNYNGLQTFYKNCSTSNLTNYLIEFKNGIINNDFCLNNVHKVKTNNETMKFVEMEDDEVDETNKENNEIFSKYDYLER